MTKKHISLLRQNLPSLSYEDIYYGLVTLIVVIVYHYSNIKRTQAGYFEDPFWMTVNTTAYLFFFAVMTGYVVTKVVKKR